MVRSGARRLVFGRRPGREQVDSVVEQLLAAHPASAGLFLDAIAAPRGVGGLGALCDVPSVVLAGEKDRLCPLAHAKVIADELPHAEFVRYPGAGHMLPQEHPNKKTHQNNTLLRT